LIDCGVALILDGMGILNIPHWTKPGGILDFIFPPLCLGCGEYTESPDSLCESCQNRVERYEFPLCLTCGSVISERNRCVDCADQSFLLFSYGNYRDPLKQVIIHFKFKGITTPALFVAREAFLRFGSSIQSLDCDGLVPIPLYASREYGRGYNQAKLYAERLSELLALPVFDDILWRVRKRKPQASLRAFQRAGNIKDVFVAEAGDTTAKRVILVDDVVTSGATVREAKRSLEVAGFVVPAVISMAHGL
jgi:ComF family protein